MLFHPSRIAATTLKIERLSVVLVGLMLSLFCSCGRRPMDRSSNSDSQNLPFDGRPRSSEISPSQSLVPASPKLPEGASIAVRLQSVVSSASSHAGDTFYAV